MRLLYVDVDSLRADHLGCYGYHRDTSPNIDALAARGTRYEEVYASDVPCLPSRTALISGRFGIRNGVINHGGARAELYPDGASRGFRSSLAASSWTAPMRAAGMRCVTVSSFATRHAAWHWYANFSEVYDPGGMGLERADHVAKIALRWIEREARREDWFLHVNLWDPHTPYRAPPEYGDPFASDPLPSWYTDQVRSRLWEEPGPHSAQEVNGYSPDGMYGDLFPRQPKRMASMDDVRTMFDGYDTGVRYADDHVGRLLNALADAGVLDDTIVILSADHGENLGELGVHGDHHTADRFTCRIPMIVTGRTGVEPRPRYHVDVAAEVLERLGLDVPDGWDGRPGGRDHLVCGQGAWCAQRMVRFEDYAYIRTWHDAWHGYPDELLFDLSADPHQQTPLDDHSTIARGRSLLAAWRDGFDRDPMDEVLAEGGPFHARQVTPAYLERLRDTGRAAWADRFEARLTPTLASQDS